MCHRISRKLFVAAATAMLLLAPSVGPALANGATPRTMPASLGSAPYVRTIKLGLNKSIVVDLPRDARDVLVSNPEIADAVMRTSRRIYLTGNKGGQTNIIVFDRAGSQIANLDILVQEDVANLTTVINRLIPGATVSAEFMSGNIVLSGGVKNANDAKKAEEIANAFLGVNPPPGSTVTTTSGSTTATNSGGGGTPQSAGNSSSSQSSSTATAGVPKVINLLSISGDDQVHLRVMVAEVQRNALKQLGINWSLENVQGSGGLVVSGATDNPFGISGSPASSIAASIIKNIVVPNYGSDPGASISAKNSVGATIKALESTGMLKTLAEPTLTAISGESASFLAGGEFPVPTGMDQNGNITIQFKQFGVSLSFTPVVLSAGRISLHVKTEVSELSNEGAIALGSVSIPSLKVRRADTTMELPSGGSMIMGGLLQENINQSIAGLPGLKNLPILGALFRSRDFQHNETELVIVATPYLVNAVPLTALARPDEGLAPADDFNGTLFGKINRIYGTQGKNAAPAGSYQGHPGFIFE